MIPFLATMIAAGALAAPAPAQPVCTVADPRAAEISGLVAFPDGGYAVMNDGSDDPDRRKIFFLNGRCEVTRSVAYPSRPRDTEDMARAPDGTLWIADIGDNSGSRETIGLWRLAPGARKPKLYRMSYPDGAHDAEALLLAPDGTPIVVTKGVGAAGVYVPGKKLKTGRTTPLDRAGAVTLPISDTSNPYGLAGRLVITGGAVSPDGSRAVLRTYADAFEFGVTGGDVLGAITTGSPRRVALPDEPQGESIAYSADGSALLTVSEGRKPPLLRYPVAAPAPTASPSAPPPSTAASPSSAAAPLVSSEPADRGMLLTAVLLLLFVGAPIGLLAYRRLAR
ncbi:hypothetical protein [Actinoplanes sp. NPDC051494]|uniref:hypothetical protein n=1 Tax=Actinoplanes sp. NPDC051494 TaxID=3363907 RepID=UPI0037A9CDEB